MDREYPPCGLISLRSLRHALWLSIQLIFIEIRTCKIGKNMDSDLAGHNVPYPSIKSGVLGV